MWCVDKSGIKAGVSRQKRWLLNHFFVNFLKEENSTVQGIYKNSIPPKRISSTVGAKKSGENIGIAESLPKKSARNRIGGGREGSPPSSSWTPKREDRGRGVDPPPPAGHSQHSKESLPPTHPPHSSGEGLPALKRSLLWTPKSEQCRLRRNLRHSRDHIRKFAIGRWGGEQGLRDWLRISFEGAGR